ncbi:MAG: hypothetical protein WHS38_01950 [Thermodesulforhabdaceae bacterium]
MINQNTERTLRAVAEFFNNIKIGYTGHSGYRKTTDLYVLLNACQDLIKQGILTPQKTVFLDLGCGDGRVNLFMSYLTRWSIGIELEDFIYDEYPLRKKELEHYLKDRNCLPLPPNIFILNGDSLNRETYDRLFKYTSTSLKDIDIFYTYITLHDVFAEFIAKEAKPTAFYMVYGFNAILPRYEGLTLVSPNVGGQGLIALYRKE